VAGLFTIDNLAAGIERWGFGEDFHNSFYARLDSMSGIAITGRWWEDILDELGRWRALRGVSKACVRERGVSRMPELRKHYRQLVSYDSGNGPEFGVVSWSDLEALFQLASEIKPVSSPVFASKLCHFIFPRAFLVADRKYTWPPRGDYAAHWTECQVKWNACTIKAELVAMLRMAIQQAMLRMAIQQPVCPSYPWATKITELCCIGARTLERGAA
jgi:hypothetical protein